PRSATGPVTRPPRPTVPITLGNVRASAGSRRRLHVLARTSTCEPVQVLGGRPAGCMMGPVFERLSVPARQVIARARDESERGRDQLALDSGHLLVGMAGREGDQAQRALAAVGPAPAT